VRARLAKSEFANLLSRTLEPRLLAAEHLRATRAATQVPKRLSIVRKRPRCGLQASNVRRHYLTKT
jgi:hypothetical protein